MKINRPDEPGYAGLNTFQKVPLVLDAKELADAEVVIVGAPMDEMVTHRPGTRFGPRAIRNAYESGDPGAWHMDLGIDPFAELRVVDYGDARIVPANPEASHRAIRSAVEDVVRAGAVPVVLGGDHSISYPAIAGVASQLETDSLAVVHFDAHADTATDNWDVRWAHGTPFRHLVDKGIVRGDRLVQIGLRGYWPWPKEWEWMRSVGVRWHRMETVVEAGIDATMETVVEQVSEARHIYLSVDVDVLDPAFAPGTGTPEPGGLSTRELLQAVRKIVLARGIVGMDVVEVSPPYDHADITAYAAQRVVTEALSALALDRSGREARPEDP